MVAVESLTFEIVFEAPQVLETYKLFRAVCHSNFSLRKSYRKRWASTDWTVLKPLGFHIKLLLLIFFSAMVVHWLLHVLFRYFDVSLSTGVEALSANFFSSR